MASAQSSPVQSRVGKSGSEGQQENIQHVLFTVCIRCFLEYEFSPKLD